MPTSVFHVVFGLGCVCCRCRGLTRCREFEESCGWYHRPNTTREKSVAGAEFGQECCEGGQWGKHTFRVWWTCHPGRRRNHWLFHLLHSAGGLLLRCGSRGTCWLNSTKGLQSSRMQRAAHVTHSTTRNPLQTFDIYKQRGDTNSTTCVA